jgi:cell division protein FtsQ
VNSGDFHDLAQGVKKQSRINATRPLQWEEEDYAEPRFRRVEQDAPRDEGVDEGVRSRAPRVPLEFQDPDEVPRLRDRVPAYREPRTSWLRPASTVGRVFLGLAALVFLCTVTASAVLLKMYLEKDAQFRINSASAIQATGLTEISRPELLPVFGADIGRNIFFVPLSQRRTQLESLPWVQKATVMRILPDQIRVSIVERHPVAFTRQGSKIGLVDADGVLLNMPAAAMAEHHYSFPVVTGINAKQDAGARKERIALYLRMMSDLDSAGNHDSDQISEIDLTDAEDARVLMTEQGADILAHFGDDNFRERYERYQAHIAEWRQQYPKLASVDLRYGQQVVLQMAPGSQSAESNSQSDAAADSAKTPAHNAVTAQSTAHSAKPAAKPHPTPVKSTIAKSAAQKIKPAKKSATLKSAAMKKAPVKPTMKTPQTSAARTHPLAALSQGGQ